MIKRLIERPVAVTMTLIAVLVLGFVSIGMLPVSLMPDIQIPQITVRVVDDNASARELDATIVKPLKNQLMQVSGQPALPDRNSGAVFLLLLLVFSFR